MGERNTGNGIGQHPATPTGESQEIATPGTLSPPPPPHSGGGWLPFLPRCGRKGLGDRGNPADHEQRKDHVMTRLDDCGSPDTIDYSKTAVVAPARGCGPPRTPAPPSPNPRSPAPATRT